VNNPLYADIEIDGNWVASAIPDDKDLVMSMLKQPECMVKVVMILSLWIQVPVMFVILSLLMPVQTPSDPVSHYADVLESFARDHGLRVHNVPRDGNCLFTSVAYQLQSVGNDVNESSLRQMVVDYSSGQGDVYSPFLPQSVASDDGYNAENESVGEKDAYIESITDPEVQQELHWQKYLRRLRQGVWGDNIAIAAMCNLFNVSISVLCANAAGTSIARNTPNSGYGTHELRIGLIMQFHFVGLDMLPVDHVDGGNPSVHSSAATEPTDAV